MKKFRPSGFNNDRKQDRGSFGDRGRDSFNNDRSRFDRKPGFKKFNDRNDAPKQMHAAICAGCGKSCQVPFRPSNNKPVFCNDCFNLQKEQSLGNFAPKPRFDKRSGYSRNERPERNFGSDSRQPAGGFDERNNRRIDELKAQVAKLTEQMTEVMAHVSQIKPAATHSEIKPEPVTATKKAKKEKPAISESKATPKKVAAKKATAKAPTKKKAVSKKK